jgi:hypothetical protein
MLEWAAAKYLEKAERDLKDGQNIIRSPNIDFFVNDRKLAHLSQQPANAYLTNNEAAKLLIYKHLARRMP